LADTGVTLAHQPDLGSAVQWCRQYAQAGEAVLLSPACASFDMFENYGHRAEVFVQAVRDIATEGGMA
jgi:UDP-N-acetylmuramoylalanine--D-glutamate ligase